jgi:hypothetical protein
MASREAVQDPKSPVYRSVWHQVLYVYALSACAILSVGFCVGLLSIHSVSAEQNPEI